MIAVLKGIGRVILAIVAFVLIWPSIALVAAVMIWWHAVGAVAWVTGRRGRMFIGRWLGAVPFSWTVVLLLAVTALFHACATGVWTRTWFRQAADGCLNKLEEMPSLKNIGGLW